MDEKKIPEEIRAFTYKYINSLEQLEILCFMYENRYEEYNPSMIAKELRTSELSVENTFKDLFSKDFIVLKNSENKFYQYGPKTDILDVGVRIIYQFYKNNYHTMINLIYSRPIENIRSFSDSFKFRKDDKNNG